MSSGIATFTQKFLPAYLRNNRRGGQKNLRCFPACSEQGHRCSGFCGRAVKVSWSTGKGEEEASLAQYCSLAEFVTEKKEKQDLHVGGVYSSTQFEDDTRCRKEPLRRFIRGVPAADVKMNRKANSSPPSTPAADVLPVNAAVCVGSSTFSYKPSCWHYSWRSNKHATDTKHWLRVYVFKLSADCMSMECVNIVDTTPFTLFSSKILDKGKRGAPAPRKKAPAKKKRKLSRTTPKFRREDMSTPPPTEQRQPLFVPTYKFTEDKFAFEQSDCPPSPVSITFFQDEKFSEEDAQMTLDALLETINVPKNAEFAGEARGPGPSPISEITESELFDVSVDMTSSFEDSLFDLLDQSVAF